MPTVKSTRRIVPRRWYQSKLINRVLTEPKPTPLTLPKGMWTEKENHLYKIDSGMNRPRNKTPPASERPPPLEPLSKEQVELAGIQTEKPGISHISSTGSSPWDLIETVLQKGKHLKGMNISMMISPSNRTTVSTITYSRKPKLPLTLTSVTRKSPGRQEPPSSMRMHSSFDSKKSRETS